VQATVRSFDATTRSGTVLLDDGVELPYDDRAFDARRVRLLRVGQRVRIEVAGDAGARRVTYLTIATLPA
jgi:2-phospho-L-lactate/phosphoenolpyruvate guanylyltransferase